MFEFPDINHHIQKHILSILYEQKIARFRDMRPPRVDTNLYSYHLKSLLGNGLVEKIDGGYTLSAKGQAYMYRIGPKEMRVLSHPKIIAMAVVQNADGDVLLQKRTRQPHADTWTLPYARVLIDDVSIRATIERMAQETLELDDANMSHVGDCYIRVMAEGKVLSSTLAHIFYCETDSIITHDEFVWARPHKLDQYDLAPAVEQIVARTLFRDPYFFEEFTEEHV